MGLFRRHRETDGDEAVQATALVIEADTPPEGASSHGTDSHGTVRVLLDTGAGPVQVSGQFRFAERHWLVPGTEVRVTFHRDRPEGFEIDWDAVPSIQDRAAANDPTLADPIEALRAVATALGLGASDAVAARAANLKAALDQATTRAVPAGRLAAVAQVVTIRGHYIDTKDPLHGAGWISPFGTRTDSGTAAVLAVNVPARPPFALYVQSLDYPDSVGVLAGAAYPATVSATDHRDVSIEWEEATAAPGTRAAGAWDLTLGEEAQRDQAMDAHAARMSQLMQQSQGRVAAFGGVPMGGAPTADQTARMAQGAAEAARNAVMRVTDPTIRKMMIDQYRAAGIDLGDLP